MPAPAACSPESADRLGAAIEARVAMTAAPADLPRPGDMLRVVAWMTGAIGSFSLMAVAGRALSPTLDTFEIMLWRSLIGLGIVGAWIAARGGARAVRTDRLGLHGARNLAHFAGQNLWFHALTAAPMAQVVALEFTSPIWALLLAPLVLGERLTWRRMAVALAGFAGVVVVAQPGTAMAPGVPFAAAAAFFFGLTALLTRRLTRDQPLATIMLWLTAMQAAFGAAMAGWDGDVALPPPDLAGWTAVVALTGLLAHLSLTKALSIAPAAVVMPVDFARLPVIAAIGAALYGEPLTASLALGAAVILGANWAGLRYEARRRA